jgi:hypothetical protein
MKRNIVDPDLSRVPKSSFNEEITFYFRFIRTTIQHHGAY